jgi:hypothetical protein
VVATMVEKDEKSLKLLMQACTQIELFFFTELSLQLKDTTNRIKALDVIAALVEKMMK